MIFRIIIALLILAGGFRAGYTWQKDTCVYVGPAGSGHNVNIREGQP